MAIMVSLIVELFLTLHLNWDAIKWQ